MRDEGRHVCSRCAPQDCWHESCRGYERERTVRPIGLKGGMLTFGGLRGEIEVCLMLRSTFIKQGETCYEAASTECPPHIGDGLRRRDWSGAGLRGGPERA